jgi:predicted extracellular nuclease
MTQGAPKYTACALAVLASLFSSAALAASDVVISQVYGGGGNSGANWKSDFIELFNRGDQPVDLSGWSVQYASSAGNTWTVTPLSGVRLAPGQYYLVQQATGTGGQTALPAPDARNDDAALSGSNGKVALVRSTAKLSGAAPVTADIVDVVGYGTANFYEGVAAPGTANTTGVLRKNGGCQDTDNNDVDFVLGTPAPRNTASATHACSSAPAAIVPTCPAALSGQAGSAVSAVLKARADGGAVSKAEIVGGAVPGIALADFIGGADATVTLNVAPNVAAGNYPVVVTFTDAAQKTASCTINVALTAGDLTISQIQGSGRTSPYANTVRSTRGVVTKKVPSGFFIQDPAGDGDPATSDGIFVFNNTYSANVGDLVRVTGTITEYTPNGATRSVTEITNVSAVKTVGSGQTIAPVSIALPDEDLGRYEGMLVRFASPLIVNGNSYLGDRGELVLASGRRETPTNAFRPGSQAARDLAAANEKNWIVLDDGIFTTPTSVPYLFADGTVRSGDTVTDLVGVVDFGAVGGGGGWYKLQPTVAPSFSRTNERSATPPASSGNVTVASANVLNFFTTFTNGDDVFGNHNGGCALGSSIARSNCRGADNLGEFERQRDKIVRELQALDADVVGLMEIQNNGDTAVRYLTEQLNKAIGANVYAYVPRPPATGTDAIRVAMLYKPAKLSLVGGALSDSDAVNNRPPMAQTFKSAATGAVFSVVVNHLKSKGGCGGAGAGDADSGDGQGCWNATRVRQATRLLTDFIPRVIASAGDPDVLAVGDFNSYGQEDPIDYLVRNGMVNELERFIRSHGDTPYSYVFDGARGYLDHALASRALDAQVVGAAEWHNNADEPDAIDYNLGDNSVDPYVANAFRASDHDPVLVSLKLAPAFADVTANVKIAQSGLTFNRFTGQSAGTVTFTNTGGAPLAGPLQFVLEGLPAGVTLVNRSGERAGAPFITLPGTTLAPGASVSVTTTFANPGKVAIAYTAKLVSGTF